MWIEVFGNGNAVRLRGLRVRKRNTVGGGVRGKISSFSSSARKRMILAIRSLDFERLSVDGYQCFFATGTYQKDVFLQFGSIEGLKRHLDIFRRSFVRKFQDSFFFWKLEFHRSGVPHLHFLFFVRGVSWGEFTVWFSREWVRTATVAFGWSSGDERVQRMYRVATNVRTVPLHLHTVLSVYVSKEVGKVIQTEHNWGWTGRFWGVVNRKVYKAYIRVDKLLLSEVDFFRLRRLFRRYLKSLGYRISIRYRTQGVLLLFTNMHFLQKLFSAYL